ncbi:hypothetical protein K443DRAFT_447717 [Laccaria amethystina LaAM-08-1]|uniref:Inositol phospholipid synthesis and fat-storage-inducing TM-domain-containing protein n=1 Tax=Laccaria amethystina LaAM-08-1 TaxID=1095629 RepID=A0A0C9XVR1_9AGAR|nr:hypothetical protein K443DRAFT_447717 [Laccaria amethystina LaAM-08-1]
MTDVRHAAFAAISIIILFGTIYSVAFNTFLDTSNALVTHLPHPLSHTHYFASKSNVLNVYFIKKVWAWTTAAFLFSWFTSPPQVKAPTRLIKYFTLTSIWLLFTAWFFGPPLLDRVIVASGGQCVIPMPTGGPIVVPNEYCFEKSTISASSHPQLFDLWAPPPPEWRGGVPRLRRGHDISGHIFMLTMSTLFLSDQLRPSFKIRVWSTLHGWAVAFNVALIGIWLFATYTTSVYFHSPLEKFTGYLLGVTCFAFTQLPIFNIGQQGGLASQEHASRSRIAVDS